MPSGAKERAVEDVPGAVDAGAMRVGQEAGLPLHHFPLERPPTPIGPCRTARSARC